MCDSLSLIWAVETAFEIRIADDEAEKVVRVSDLQSLVETKLAHSWPRAQSGACISMMAFHRVRRALMKLEVERGALRPRAALEALLPRQNRGNRWEELSRELNVKLPGLQSSSPLSWTKDLVFLIQIIVIFGTPLVGSMWFLPCLMGSFLMWSVMSYFATLSEIDFPRKFVQIGDIAREIAATSHIEFVAKRGFWTQNEAWSALQWLIARECDVEVSRVTPEARFFEDLDLVD